MEHAVYPAHLVQRLHLRHGGPVTIRPVRRDDADLLQALVRSLSPRSRYCRFMHAMNELPPDLLVRFVDIDYRRQMTLIATVVEPAGEMPVGMAQYVAEPGAEGCDSALLVHDDWHRRGLGSLLLDSLALCAGAASYAYIEGDVLADNCAMLEMARSRGFSIRHYAGSSGLMRVRASLGVCVAAGGTAALPLAA